MKSEQEQEVKAMESVVAENLRCLANIASRLAAPHTADAVAVTVHLTSGMHALARLATLRREAP